MNSGGRVNKPEYEGAEVRRGAPGMCGKTTQCRQRCGVGGSVRLAGERGCTGVAATLVLLSAPCGGRAAAAAGLTQAWFTARCAVQE